MGMIGGMPGGMPGGEGSAYARRYGGEGARPIVEEGGPAAPSVATGAPGAPTPPGTNQVDTINVICRGVNLSAVSPSANTDIAFALETQLKENPLFEAKETTLTGNLNTDEPTGTFVFGMTLKLKRPLKL